MTVQTQAPLPLLARVNWIVLIVFILLHAAVVAAPFTFSWGAVAAFLVLHWISACLGISLCFHRLLTHRSMRAVRPLEALLALCGCLAWQGSPTDWVATHRKHHSTTDRVGDPHSPHAPRESFWWGHLGWLILPDPELRHDGLARKYAPDLLEDPMYQFFQRTYPIYQVLLGIGLYLLGGWGYVVWGVALRTVVVWHSTWLVNSATHMWGYRRFQTKDDSTNLWWVALLTYGEGWHNNHHGDPRAAVYGRRWWEVDPTYTLVRLLELLRLAHDVRRPRRAPTA
jgi:fatty-acid desaturase